MTTKQSSACFGVEVCNGDPIIGILVNFFSGKITYDFGYFSHIIQYDNLYLISKDVTMLMNVSKKSMAGIVSTVATIVTLVCSVIHEVGASP